MVNDRGPAVRGPRIHREERTPWIAKRSSDAVRDRMAGPYVRLGARRELPLAQGSRSSSTGLLVRTAVGPAGWIAAQA